MVPRVSRTARQALADPRVRCTALLALGVKGSTLVALAAPGKECTALMAPGVGCTALAAALAVPDGLRAVPTAMAAGRGAHPRRAAAPEALGRTAEIGRAHV